MKKSKQQKKTYKQAGSSIQTSEPGYGGQDFDQGRGGKQSGHASGETAIFSQFQNDGSAGYAGEAGVGSAVNSKEPGKE